MKFPMFEINSKEFIDDYDFTSLFIQRDPNTFLFKTLNDAENYIDGAIYIDCNGNRFIIRKTNLYKSKGCLSILFRRKFALSFKLIPFDYNISLDEFKRIFVERLVAQSNTNYVIDSSK